MSEHWYAWVEVRDSEGRPYWNPLSPQARSTQAEAAQDALEYVVHKKHGTGGFRKGAPGRTKIEPSRD